MPSIGKINIIPKGSCEVDWRISDFFSLSTTDGQRYYSPEFFFADALWSLMIYSNGRSAHASTGYVGAYIWRKSFGPEINLEFPFGLKTLEGIKKEEHIRQTVFETTKTTGIHKFLSRSNLIGRKSELMPDGFFTLFCTLRDVKSTEDFGGTEDTKCSHCKEILNPEDFLLHEKKCINKPIKCTECSIVVALKNWYEHECEMIEETGQNTSDSDVLPEKNKILQDFKQLFHSQEDTDVVFRVEGREFPAHRAILKARSPVLASTFRNDMKEKSTGRVDIEDCDPSIFSDFLCFLYCEDVDSLSEENVFGLFTAADKYDVQDLMTICLKFIKENLYVDTFCETITLALQYSETDLISLTTDFFLGNADKIIVTAKWQSFAAENPTQSNELFIKFVESVKCSKS